MAAIEGGCSDAGVPSTRVLGGRGVTSTVARPWCPVWPSWLWRRGGTCVGGCGWPHPRDDPPVNTFRVVHCSTDVPRKTLRGDLSLKSRQPEGAGGDGGNLVVRHRLVGVNLRRNPRFALVSQGLRTFPFPIESHQDTPNLLPLFHGRSTQHQPWNDPQGRRGRHGTSSGVR